MRAGIQIQPQQVEVLKRTFADRLAMNVPLGQYTSIRIGGPADFLLKVHSGADLEAAARKLWELEVPFRVLGAGSNVLVADSGVRGMVILNRARRVQFIETTEGWEVWAESGASFSAVARQAVERGLAGLEWATTIPGTVGGAVVGNAGAYGGEVAKSILMADILQPKIERESWPAHRLQFAYRSSWLKRDSGDAVLIGAQFRLEKSGKTKTRAKMEDFIAQRKQMQPAGASCGSIFKNPPGDYAGRLIESAGLKGLRIGGVEISSQHANFFINRGDATAADIWKLIQTARQRVADDSGVKLELEVELLGTWDEACLAAEEPRGSEE